MGEESQHSSEGHITNQHPTEISYLMRREIQAPVAACLIRGFISVMGHDQAVEIAITAIQADAMTAGKTAAEVSGANTMRELGRFIREVWTQDNALTIRILEETDRFLVFNVIRCRYAEMYDRLGMKEFGFCLSCSRDEPFARGFNPRIKMTRTQTIMQGASFCDFRFILE